MKNIRIEEVGDIHSTYNYLEVFYQKNSNPFLDISISNTKELSFKFYELKTELSINLEELEYIISTAKDFLPRVLSNEED